MKNFKLKGSSAENFRKLEKVLPRVFRRLGTKTYGIIPSSILQAYKEKVSSDGLIFRCCLFAGKIKKVSFLIMDIDGKETPKYQCKIHTPNEERCFNFTTKKKSYTQDINVDVFDGDYIEIKQIIEEDSPVLSDLHISVLMNIDKGTQEVIEQLTNDLFSEKEIDFEGI